MPRTLTNLTLACALSGSPALAADQTYPATIVRVVDGDSAVAYVPAWASTPFATISIRVATIDTPESRMPPAKCKAEVEAGKAASAYARGLVRPGDAVTLGFKGFDKYGGRVDASVTLPDGRDWATVMLSTGFARPYAGGAKGSWCRKPPRLSLGG